MTTVLQNLQQKYPVQETALQKLADFLALRLEEKSAPEQWSEVCIVLTDNAGITEPNREYFKKNRPTDVISFRYDPVPGEEEGFSGDLIVNVERAAEVGADHNGIDYELALYIAHGFDHLTGAEDDTPEKKAAMLKTETNWLSLAVEDGFLDRLFSASLF